MKDSKYISLHGQLYRRIGAEVAPPATISVKGQKYRLVGAAPGSYEMLKASVVGNGGMVDTVMDQLRKIAENVTEFGQMVQHDDPNFVTKLSSNRREDDKISSVAYDLGDLIAQLERVSDRMAAALRGEAVPQMPIRRLP